MNGICQDKWRLPFNYQKQKSPSIKCFRYLDPHHSLIRINFQLCIYYLYYFFLKIVQTVKYNKTTSLGAVHYHTTQRGKGLFINYVTQSGGVNLCVTLWSDGRVKWSFWHYRGGEGVNFWPKWSWVINEWPLREGPRLGVTLVQCFPTL